MSNVEFLQQLEALSREELDQVAERVDQLRDVDLTADERTLLRDRVTEYRKNPHDVLDLDDVAAEILGRRP